LLNTWLVTRSEIATGMGVEPAYATHYLVPTMLTGIGVGLSFASWGSAAVAQLPPARFATGSALLSCLRQIGAVLGIAALVALLDAAPAGDPLAGFTEAWALMAVSGGVVAVLALALGRVGLPAVAPPAEAVAR